MAEMIASSSFLTAMGIWLGGVVFFSFFTAPVLFDRLPREQAAEVITVIFPRYYNLSYFCGIVMVGAGVYPVYLEGSFAIWSSEILALGSLVISLWAGRVVMPRVRRLRLAAASSAGTAEYARNRDEYERSHSLSLTLNVLVLISLMTQTLLYGYRVRFDFVGN